MCVCKIELDEILIIEIIYLQIKVHVPGLKAKITRLNHFLHKIFRFMSNFEAMQQSTLCILDFIFTISGGTGTRNLILGYLKSAEKWV